MDPNSRLRGRRTQASPDRLLTAGERRWLLVGVALTTLAVAGAELATKPGWARLFDNAHWTVAYGFAAALAISAARRATGTLRRARWWFAAGLGALFGGQLLWDIQVAVGWNPFPGPSDGLFASMGVLLAVGALALTRSQSEPRRIAVALDGLGFGLSVLALSLALYIPEQGDFGSFTLAVLAVYPTALLTATALLAMVLLELRERPRWRYLTLLAGVASQGVLWMAWNQLTLENRLADATLLNFLFSYSALLVAVGVATFAPAGVEVGGRLARVYDIVSRLLPLGFVIAAAAAVAGSSRLLLLPPVRLAVMICMGGVILVAILRQSLLLEERDRLLAAEEQNRILQQRFAESRRLEALGTLAGGIAHDFNNVLTAILGHAELLALRPGLDAQAQESIHGVRAAAARARDMVRRILAFSRQDAGRPEVVDVLALVREVVALLRAGLPVRHQLVVEAHQQPRVTIIPAQLHQVLMNLGTNASQAIGERVGTVTFAVSAVTVGADDLQLTAGRYAEVAVTDDGLGMDAATQSRIFEPFFTTKPRGEGTGLGLSVVHGIISERGGAIRVRSAVGKGSTLRLLLPLADADSDSRRGPGPASAPPLAAGANGVVLVVDDDLTIGRLLVRLLAVHGQTAVAVTSGEEALALFRQDPIRYRLVVTDMAMPTMNGAELAAALRSARPELAIVLSSGTDFVLAGTPFDDVLPKPYSARAVSELLARQGASRSPTKHADPGPAEGPG